MVSLTLFSNIDTLTLTVSQIKGNWNTHLGSSPGSSSASWSSGSPSPPLSDDGKPEQRNRTTSLSTSDEGIVMDYSEEMPRKKTVSFFFYS